MNKIETLNKNKLLDILKFVCAILIVGSHTLPIFKQDILNLYYGQWFFRFCVPLFFISSGFYFEKMSNDKKLLYIKRILIIYLVSTALYMPVLITQKIVNSFVSLICTLLWGHHHLWYLIALFTALVISYLLNKFMPLEKKKFVYYILIVSLLTVGIFFDEYYKIFDNDILKKISHLINIFGSSRNFLFMALPLITIGRLIFVNKEKLFSVAYYKYIILTILFSLLSLVEVTILVKLNISGLTCDMSLFNFYPAIFLFILTFYWSPIGLNNTTKCLRKNADIVYILHPLFIYILSEFTNLNYFPKFLIVLLLSFVSSVLFNYILTKIKNFKVQNEKS
ncbi:MAG: acyltransferase family protein [Clostridia bacterium]|nr:acyltransferase family protein [Clostridia bacterium]